MKLSNWWDDMPFLQTHVEAAWGDIQGILASLKVVADAKFTTFPHPAVAVPASAAPAAAPGLPPPAAAPPPSGAGGAPAARPGAPQPAPPPEPPPAPSANLARGKPASQSSLAYAAPAGRAVDGNSDGDYTRGSVTHTDAEREAWWQVDLGTSPRIDRVAVWNRTDCCAERLSKFYVLVSDAPFASSSLQTALGQPGVSQYYVDGVAARPTEIPIARTGRYVRIQLAGTNYLSIAELEVIGAGAAGLLPPIVPSPGAAAGSSVGAGDLAAAFGASPATFARDFKDRAIRVSAQFQQVQLTGNNPIVFVRIGDWKIVCAQAQSATSQPLARTGLGTPVWISGQMLLIEGNQLWLQPGCVVGTE
jgi:hypothetical protein